MYMMMMMAVETCDASNVTLACHGFPQSDPRRAKVASLSCRDGAAQSLCFYENHKDNDAYSEKKNFFMLPER